MNFINSGKGYKLFEYTAKNSLYIDKTMLIDKVYSYAVETNRYICITRPRRFGKSTAADMLAAFFDRNLAKKSKALFEELEIKNIKDRKAVNNCWREQGKLNVIRINMIDLITEDVKSYADFQKKFERLFIEDILEKYNNLTIYKDSSFSEILDKTGDSFVFIIDEWDSIFVRPFMSRSDKENYILFLKALLKDKAYVKFAYMTGILPVAKYSSGSPLNMFHEFNAYNDTVFFKWFGFTKDEIRMLMKEKGIKRPTLKDLSLWYDGYISGKSGVHIYNPNSVVRALTEGTCQSFWTGTGPMNEIKDIIKNNVEDVRADILRMASGETLDIELEGFSAEKDKVSTRDEILSAMVVYGFLTYHNKGLSIPNHELLLKFREALAFEGLGLKQTLEESKRLLEATLNRDHNMIADLLETLHDDKIPFFNYNDENSLACVVTLGYISALDEYRISRENKAGKGYVDFLFTPIKHGGTVIILELKYNHSAENAIKCIHEREYVKKLKGYKKVLLVGINYSEKTKKHTCLTELVEQ